MTFEREWALALLAVVGVFGWREWSRARSRPGFVLKVAVLALVVLALAEPTLPVNETKMAVTVLVDTSASVPPQDLERAGEIAKRIQQARGRHTVRVVPFARTTRPLLEDETGREWKFRTTSGDNGRATDLEAAIREAAASLPAGQIGRLVLVSDGKENRGSAVRAAWLARQLGLAVDSYPLTGRPQPSLRLETMQLPARAFTGERFPVDLVISSPRAASAVAEVFAEGRTLGSHPVQLEPGLNSVRVFSSLSAAGAIDVSGVIRAEGLGEVRFEHALAVRKPRVLFVTGDQPRTDSHLTALLEAGRFEVERVENIGGARLSEYQLVIFNNHNLEAIPAPRKRDIEEYVKDGGGLLVIGGEQNVYVEGKKEEDPLERALPAKLAPPRSPEGTMVILIIDKSSSMEGRKMELARLAAIGVIENLRSVDLVGVLIFDNSFQWAVPVRRAEDRSTIKRLVAGITPDGGTQIAPALTEAYRRSLPVRATFKHIVLLTDGISEEGDSIALAKEAALQRVTISTVGLGQDVNRAYLEKVASFAHGRSYFLTDPSGLEQILLRDVMEHTGSTAVEKPVSIEVTKQAEILDGVDMASAPALKGYVKFISKPTADTILTLDTRDPLLARWQYGLGRAAVFTSDAKPRWASEWMTWPSFDRFWANLLRDLLPHAQAGEARLDYDSAGGDLVVEYRLADGIPEPAQAPQLYAFGPDSFQKPLDLKKTAPGVYAGKLAIGNQRGLFRVRPLAESMAFPEVGLYRPEDELNEYGSDENLLKQISAFTGGRFEPRPSQVFDPGNRIVPATIRLWPVLLGLAILANLFELVLRKWAGVLEFFRRRASARA